MIEVGNFQLLRSQEFAALTGLSKVVEFVTSAFKCHLQISIGSRQMTDA